MNNNSNEINELDSNDQELSTDKPSLSVQEPVIARDSEVVPKKKAGRPRHLVLATTQNEVYELSKVGTRHEDIATLIGVSHDTLTKYYKKQLDRGRIEANAAVAGTMYSKAMTGDVGAMMFWLKTQAQWSEKNTTELTGEGGSPINIKVITGID